jgi:hypothetical protein
VKTQAEWLADYEKINDARLRAEFREKHAKELGIA